MGIQATVVFTDLHGSTAVFESFGNAQATETITQITAWIVGHCEKARGRVVKTLGDGVLALFDDGESAVKAVVEMQREHAKRNVHSFYKVALPLRIGLASGEIELVDNDCYGDAVNVASRLCDLCGPHQIWANSPSLHHVSEAHGVTFRMLGPISIRGRAEPVSVYQIEWREDPASEFLTMQGDVDPHAIDGIADVLGREIELKWLDQTKRFRSFELPAHIGRVRNVDFMVNDPRVSRTHARLEWRNGSVVLVDLSSYGSWVRFAGSNGAEVLLRREECVLHGSGELALGASFADASVPTVQFTVT